MFEFALDAFDADGKSSPHLVLERERLDHAHALKRFLHRLDDARAAGELRPRDAAHAAHQLAQDQERRRSHDEADKRHDRILDHHHDRQSDERQQVAADGGDEKIDNLATALAPVVSRAMNSDE